MRISVWHDADKGGFAWDDAEDHGGFDRVSPNGYFQTRAAAEHDARETFPGVSIQFEDGPPDHYADDDSSADYVGYYLNGEGYSVEVYDKAGRIIEEYRAGNHPLDSQAVAVHCRPVPTGRLLKWALQTARETAERYSPVPRVWHDRDSQKSAIEEVKERRRA